MAFLHTSADVEAQRNKRWAVPCGREREEDAEGYIEDVCMDLQLTRIERKIA